MRRFAVILAIALPVLAADSVPPKLKLPTSVVPINYALDLTILPEKETFDGTVDIDTQVKQPTTTLWLNSTGLTIKEVTFTPKGNKAIQAKPSQVGEDFLSLTLDRTIKPGRGRIHIRYTGSMSRKNTSGIFTQQDGGNWYAYTQFEAIHARKALPCFDEPGHKTPWQVTLHVPKDASAFSNNPVAHESIEKDGLKAVQFTTTKPLPSYLIAFGVGPFEVIDAGTAGKKKTPIRIVVPNGHKADAAYAVEVIPQLFTRLENYFGVPYPYEKLDHLAIPFTAAFGAMENAGLITYSSRFLLANPKDLSIDFKRGCVGFAAHEMAHMWFGDLVTMSWWNETWLNEGFASWMGDKMMNELKPEWDGEVSRVEYLRSTINTDSLLSARMIRQSIETKDDIENAFDGITYNKGAAVLTMFESYLGEAAFRSGVRQYLRKFAHGNATTKDFIASLATKGDERIPGAFNTFLDQAGVPSINVELKSDKGGASLHLSQRRYLPFGSKIPAPQVWQIPITLRYSTHRKLFEKRILMDSASKVVKLPIASKDLDYLLLNQKTNGYFHTHYQGDLFTRLLQHEKDLSIPERLGLLGDVLLATKAGELQVAEALALIPRYASDPNPKIVAAAAGIAWKAKTLMPEQYRPNYARLIQKCFGAQARELGLLAKPGDSENTRLLREALVYEVGAGGEDQGLQTQARELTMKWLNDRSSLDQDSLKTILALSARYGDRDLVDRLLAAAKASKDKPETQMILMALSSINNPEIKKVALAEVLTDSFDPPTSAILLFSNSNNPEIHQISFDFMKKNFEIIMAKMPLEYGAYMPMLVGTFDDSTHRVEVDNFFRGRMSNYPGGPRNLDQVLEGISIREEVKKAQQPGVISFLSKY